MPECTKTRISNKFKEYCQGDPKTEINLNDNNLSVPDTLNGGTEVYIEEVYSAVEELLRRRTSSVYTNKEIREIAVGDKLKNISFMTKIDLTARILFPFMYFMYNIIYFFYYSIEKAE